MTPGDLQGKTFALTNIEILILMDAFRLNMNKRFGDRSVSLLQDESDGALSAPEMPSIRRDRGIKI